MDLIYLIIILSAFVFLYFYFTKRYNHWKNQNVPHAPGAIPLFGHILPLLKLQDNLGSLVHKFYRAMGHNSMYGCYMMQTPAIVLRDPDLIKKVLLTDFSHFKNNLAKTSEHLDPILTRNPFFAKDSVWSESRSQLAENFSGKKLKSLLITSLQVCEKLQKHVDLKIKEGGRTAELEVKELFMKFCAEIVANTAFGVEGENFKDNPGPHSVLHLAKKVIDPSGSNIIRWIMMYFFPREANFLGISLVPKQIHNRIISYLRNIINIKLKNNDEHSDFLQFSMKDVGVVDENMMAAQATSILFDGYEGISSVSSFLIYQLANNPHAQEKAREEVNSVLKTFDNKLTYEALNSMQYLEQAAYETLRLHPDFGELTRVCNKEITLEGYDNLTCHLKPGDIVFIPVSGLHVDEEFWPNPRDFIPERFDSANGVKYNRFTYMGFAQGPRKCPGLRMGMMIVKAAAAVILKNYSLQTSSKMKNSLELSSLSFATIVKGGLWVNFEPFSEEE